MSNQNTALGAVAQARMALKHRQPGNAREQIERAERALLNLQQIHPDPHLDDALKQLAAARAALDANDTATVEQRLAGASQDLEVTFASTTVPGTQPSPAIGDAVYDANGQEIDPILTFVVDPNGQVQSVIISVGDYLGTGEKTVAVPRSEIAGDSAHPIFNGNKDEAAAGSELLGDEHSFRHVDAGALTYILDGPRRHCHLAGVGEVFPLLRQTPSRATGPPF